jgi:transcriptional regulator GlxA family with amidase domain
MTRDVAILAFDQMEVLDFAGPFEVLTTCNRVAERSGVEVPFRVTNVADMPMVRARAGMTIVVDRHLRDVLHVDVVGVPGGVTSDVEVNERVTSWLRTITDDVEIVASVCTGVFVLAAAGVVHDEEVTTHWEDVDELSARFPRLQVRRDVRWVDQGRVVTSAGISAGIDMSLHLVERLASAELAQATAHRMDYDWRR